jgi:quinol monooxygenase YgiN
MSRTKNHVAYVLGRNAREEFDVAPTIHGDFIAASLLLGLPSQPVMAQGGPGAMVIVVELEIIPSELEAFKAAIKENGQACVREEPGCQQFNIVFEKDNPNRVMLFEIYDSAEAYAAHQATPHFKKYGATIKDMIKSRKRTEMTALVLNGKGR